MSVFYKKQLFNYQFGIYMSTEKYFIRRVLLLRATHAFVCASTRDMNSSNSNSNGRCDNSKDDVTSNHINLSDGEDVYVTKAKEFVHSYIRDIFHPPCDTITLERKDQFGRLVRTKMARHEFSRELGTYRSWRINEETFNFLTQTFALVLFECLQADDFSPSKALMNLAFTFHIDVAEECHVPIHEPVTIELENLTSGDDDDVYSHDDSNHCGGVSERANKFLNWFGEITKRKSSSSSPPSSDKRVSSYKRTSRSSSESSQTGGSTKATIALTDKKRKWYLHQTLQDQAIWKSQRFWSAAFFNAVNGECRIMRNGIDSGGIVAGGGGSEESSSLCWKDVSQEKRDAVKLEVRNSTFGQLGSFLNNMRLLGIGERTCMRFMEKQAEIAALDDEQCALLRTLIIS